MESLLHHHRHSLLLPSPTSCHSVACLQSYVFCDHHLLLPRLTSHTPSMHPNRLHRRCPPLWSCKSLRAQVGSSPAPRSSAKQQLLTTLTGVLPIETASEFCCALHPCNNSLMSTGIKEQSRPKALPATAVSSPLFEASWGHDNLYRYQMLSRKSFRIHLITFRRRGLWVCFGGGKRPRKPRIWKTKQRRGTVSKSEKLVQHVEGLSNVKEEVYGALDTFIAWDLEFPLITVKKALKTFQLRKDWKRIIQISKWMLSKGQGRTLGTYSLLLEALNEEGRLEEAEEIWQKIFKENAECVPRNLFSYVISMYEKHGMYDKLLEVFADMEELGVKPHMPIVQRVAHTYEKLGMLDKTEKVWKKYPPRIVVEYGQFKGKLIEVPSSRTAQNGVNMYVGLEGNTEDMDSADSSKDAMFNRNDNDYFSDIDHFSEEPLEEKTNSLEQFQQEDNAIVPTGK